MRSNRNRTVTILIVVAGLAVGLTVQGAGGLDRAAGKSGPPPTIAGVTRGDLAETGSSTSGSRHGISIQLDNPLVHSTPAIKVDGRLELQLTKTAATQLVNESFEGAFPPQGWQVGRGAQHIFTSCTTMADVDWGKASDRASSGASSIWNAQDGAAAPGVGGDSPECTFSWVIMGPFDLSAVTSGQLEFDLYLDTEDGYDAFIWWASTDGQSFSGPYEDQSTNAWTPYTQDLRSFGQDASQQPVDLTGQSSVWIAFTYASDDSITFPGAWVDDVVLTVDGGGSNPPTANFTWAPDSPQVGSAVQFSDTSTGSPTSWSWSFGDGASSSQQNPSHVYGAAGAYAAQLTASNATGSDSISKTVTVTGGGTGGGYTYTTSADFDQGALVGLEHQTTADQLQLSTQTGTLPFLWVPNSNTHTISKIDTSTGNELGRYFVGPTNVGQNSSRTTVDLQGNCWVGNRGAGTAVKVGLYEAGQCFDRNNNGTIETSLDANGDGDISDTETLPWGSDECVLWEVVLINNSTGTYRPGDYQGAYQGNYIRALAIDASNNVWAGIYNDKKYYYINNSNGQVLQTIDVSSTGTRPYGAVIDRNGMLWSASYPDYWVLRINPATGDLTKVDLTHLSYGLAIDGNGRLFVSGYYEKMSRINISNATVDWTVDTIGGGKGVAVTGDNDVWLAGRTAYQVGRYSNSGTLKATIDLGFGPTGVAIDANGKIWSMGDTSGTIKRIDPATNAVDLTKDVLGTSTHYGYSDMTGIVARSVTTRIGTWTVNHDSGAANTRWGTLSWNAQEPAGTSVTVRTRSSNTLATWSGWEQASNGVGLTTVPDGRYLQVEVTLQLTSGTVSPILYDLTVTPIGGGGACTLTCSATVPSAGQAGSAVSFRSSATPSNCAGTVAYQWDFGDNTASSNQQNPNHAYAAVGTYTWQLVASVQGVTCTRSGTITISAGGGTTNPCAGNFVYVVPGGGHLPGANNTQWVSDLGMFNLSNSAAQVDIDLLERDSNNSTVQSISTTVAAAAGKEMPDVFLNQFGQNNIAGALRMCSTQPIQVMSRTYNDAPTGTFGQGIPGYLDSLAIQSWQTGRLIFLYENSTYRTNAGFVNTTGGNVTVTATFFDANGSNIGSRNYNLSPFGYIQRSRIFTEVGGANIANGSITVTCNAGAIFAYASLIDNAVGDPTFMIAEIE